MATFGQQASKVTQLADALSQAISRKEFLEGDSLPSINQLSAQYGVSRDTVFKAFLDLRERGLIDSTSRQGLLCNEPGDQCFIAARPIYSFQRSLIQ